VVNSEAESLGLEEYINGMVKWAEKWQMEFNPGNCEVIQHLPFDEEVFNEWHGTRKLACLSIDL